MNTLGQTLKSAREQAGISLNEVATSTKISMRTLQAIEEADMEELPPRTFLRGFVQTYAKYLKLDHKEVLNQFSKEYDLNSESQEELQLVEEMEKIEALRPETSSEKAPPAWLSALNIFNDSKLKAKALGIGGIVLLIIVIVASKSTYEKYQKESITPPKAAIDQLVSEAKENMPETDNIEAKPENSSEKTEKSKAEPKNEEVVNVQKVPSVAPTHKPVKEEKIIEAAEAPPQKAEPSPAVTAAASPQEIIIEALDAVTLDFRIDNGALQSVDLSPEQVHIIKAKSHLAIDISDGGVVSLVHNGKDLGVPGDLGKKIKVKFP